MSQTAKPYLNGSASSSMAEPGSNTLLRSLRTYEFRLLRCSISYDQTSPTHETSITSSPLQSSIESLLNSIESGHYSKALASESAAFLLNLDQASSSYSSSITNCINSYLNSQSTNCTIEERVFLLATVAISAFLAFIQSNVTGPLETSLPPLFTDTSKEDVEIWARNEAMSAGSDLLGKFSNMEYLIFAKVLLLRIRDYLLLEYTQRNGNSLIFPTISWWLARVLLIQQKLLDGLSSALFQKLQDLIPETLSQFGDLQKASSYWSGIEEEILIDIISTLHLEIGIINFRYGRVDSSKSHFESAEKASGLSLSVSGSLGFRTVHQVDPKAQLRLITNNTSSINILSDSNSNSSQDNHQVHESSDIFLTPKFLEPKDENSLKPVQQALILAQCLLIEKNTPHDEMQRWDMAPYIESVDSQPSSFIIQNFCDLLRIRWEKTRSRTKERAILMMDKLVQGIYDSTPEVPSRISFLFTVDFPSIPSLRKEYADLLVSCGLIGEAVKTYEDLQLWDNVIFCYRLLQKKAASVELINSQLQKFPKDPRLWCSLGDVTNDDKCYEKALEVSDNKSVRAKRSLARSAYNRGEYEKSKNLWEDAMRLNSMYPDGWFALGAAALKSRDFEKSLDAFSRAVMLDPDNGEAWNNIACLHMTKGRSKEAVVAFKEALKYKRDSWQMWENYSKVAFDSGNIEICLNAIQMVLNLSKYKCIDIDLLEKVMERVEVEKGREGDLMGELLKGIVVNSGGVGVWGVYGRWYRKKGDLGMCSEAWLKEVRACGGAEVWKERERFVKYAGALLELCKVYVEIGGRRELGAGEMHLKSAVKQGKERFEDTDEFREMEMLLEKLRMMLKDSEGA